MNRYRYEYAAGVKGRARYLVLDVKRGTPDKYISDPAERAVAQCWSADDAQMVAEALNALDAIRSFMGEPALGC